MVFVQERKLHLFDVSYLIMLSQVIVATKQLFCNKDCTFWRTTTKESAIHKLFKETCWKVPHNRISSEARDCPTRPRLLKISSAYRQDPTSKKELNEYSQHGAPSSWWPSGLVGLVDVGRCVEIDHLVVVGRARGHLVRHKRLVGAERRPPGRGGGLAARGFRLSATCGASIQNEFTSGAENPSHTLPGGWLMRAIGYYVKIGLCVLSFALEVNLHSRGSIFLPRRTETNHILWRIPIYVWEYIYFDLNSFIARTTLKA